MTEPTDIDKLVALAREGRRPDQDTVRDILTRGIEALEVPTDDHSVRWNAKAWVEAEPWSSGTRARLRDLAKTLDDGTSKDGWVQISRKDVFSRADLGWLDLFLAAMAWGFGVRGYGWYRTGHIIRKAGDVAVARAVEQLASAGRVGSSAAWQAWSPRGEAKLEGLGSAFASKVAYFAAFDRVSERGPLICDINTAWALWALGGIWDSRATADLYSQYVAWSEHWAVELRRRPDDIERALFTIGPPLQLAWKWRPR
jgi:hypothetical protein